VDQGRRARRLPRAGARPVPRAYRHRARAPAVTAHHHSPIGRLVAARALNTLGRAVINATVMWELYERTHDPRVLAEVGLVQVIPVVLLFVWAGALVDRTDRRTLITITSSAIGAVGVGLAAASATAAPPSVYLALLLGLGCITAIHAPAGSSLVPL